MTEEDFAFDDPDGGTGEFGGTDPSDNVESPQQGGGQGAATAGTPGLVKGPVGVAEAGSSVVDLSAADDPAEGKSAMELQRREAFLRSNLKKQRGRRLSPKGRLPASGDGSGSDAEGYAVPAILSVFAVLS